MNPATSCSLGLRAQRGGAVAVAVTLDGGLPDIVLSTFLATAAEDDRLAREPYHVAAELARSAARSAEIEATVAEGLARQAAAAAESLGALLTQLESRGQRLAGAVLLINRAGWVTDLLSYSLQYSDHPPVAEGLAVRETLRQALQQPGIAVAEVDEKSLLEAGQLKLGLEPADLDRRLKDLGRKAGKPWRREQKVAALAAWLALAEGT